MPVGIRTVTVELLRKGPAHNQLLSPLTEYLGICGDSGAGSVSLPYEQATFNGQLSELRYEDDDEQDRAPRHRALRQLGSDLGEVLGQVPGFIGALQERDEKRPLINLRLVTSASELSLLPFELAKMPSATGRSTDEWLALQASTPVCITRRVRSVPPSTETWPRDATPRILFVVGLDVDKELQEQHRAALRRELAYWQSDESELLLELNADCEDTAEDFEAALQSGARQRATAANLGRALALGIPYVHILAHGAETGEMEAPTYGALLAGPGKDEIDIVVGERFASLLRAVPTGVPRPASVLLATCDSGNQADVLTPGGSFAHALHLAGIPLVVASQFPLSTVASTSMTELFYAELLWSEHPLETLSRIRARLHGEFADTHDWASLVIYDALPDDLEDQLAETRYQRARAALSRAQGEFARAAVAEEPDLDEVHAAMDRAERFELCLPEHERYQGEVTGLRASHRKQLGETRYRLQQYNVARQRLEEARKLYHRSALIFLRQSDIPQYYAKLDWVVTQALSMDRVLGKPPPPDFWYVAFRSAQTGLEDDADNYWSHGTMVELWLLRMFDILDLDEGEEVNEGSRKEVKDEAVSHARAILDAVHPEHFAVFSTRRQMERYASLWGTAEFEANLGLTRAPAWTAEDGVVELARELVETLTVS